jgi:hypothetical protein
MSLPATDANQELVGHLAKAPSQIQPLLTSMATHCRPDLHEGHLYVTVPFAAVEEAVQKARSIHRSDVLASVLILSMTMAATVVGVMLFIR